MNFKEVQDLLKMMNVDMNEHHAHRLFTVCHRFLKAGRHPPSPLFFLASTHSSVPVCLFYRQMADKSLSGTLEDDEFVLFYKMLTQREDVLRVFQEYSVDGQKLSQRDLEDFLREEQLEDGNIEQQAKQLIERYEPSDTGIFMLRT